MKSFLILLLASSASAFSVDRRAFVNAAAAAAVAGVSSPPANAAFGALPKDSVVQREINSFNDLINNFKDTTLNGGLDASKLTEPSVSFIEFGDKMKKGEVALVEFMAPEGNVAYVTFKPSKDDKSPPQRVRIGQGYPSTSKNSWSSPDYVIRSVSNFGVPYKFVVPALEKFKVKA